MRAIPAVCIALAASAASIRAADAPPAPEPASVEKRLAALEAKLAATEIRFDAVLKKIDDVLWFERVGDVADVDKVYITGPPSPKAEDDLRDRERAPPVQVLALRLRAEEARPLAARRRCSSCRTAASTPTSPRTTPTSCAS